MYRKILLIAVIGLLAALTFTMLTETSAAQDRQNQQRDIGPALGPGERYFMIGATAFDTGVDTTAWNKNTNIYYTAGTLGSNVYFYAPIYLRNKAYITRLDLIGRDSNSSLDMEIDLISVNTNGAQTTHQSVSSSGNESFVRTFYQGGFSLRASGGRAYYLRLLMPAGIGGATNMRFYFARIVVKGY